MSEKLIIFDTSPRDGEQSLGDKKHEIFDDDLQALVTETKKCSINEYYSLVSLQVCSATSETPNANICLNINNLELNASSDGGGLVGATVRAIEKMADSGTQLQLYSVNNITTGTDSLGEVTVRLERSGTIVNLQGSDTDIVIASAKAYINALNKIATPVQRTHPQTTQI